MYALGCIDMYETFRYCSKIYDNKPTDKQNFDEARRSHIFKWNERCTLKWAETESTMMATMMFISIKELSITYVEKNAIVTAGCGPQPIIYVVVP